MHVCRVTVAASACQQPCLHESERTAAARPFNPPPLLWKFLCSGCCPSCVNVEAFDSTSFISPLLLRLLAGTEGWSDGVRSVPKDGICWNKEQQWLTGETHTACLMLYVRQRQLFATLLKCFGWVTMLFYLYVAYKYSSSTTSEVWIVSGNSRGKNLHPRFETTINVSVSSS